MINILPKLTSINNVDITCITGLYKADIRV